MQLTLRNYLIDEKIKELTIEKIKIQDSALLEGRKPNAEEQASIDAIEKKIEFMDNNAERIYVAPCIKGIMYKEFFNVQGLEIDKTNPQNIVKIVDFICNIYGNQFTAEQFLKGIKINEFASTITATMETIYDMMMQGVNQVDTQR